VFAQTVAEMALGMMLDLARGIAAADRAFREGREVYGLESNTDSFLIKGQPVGLIGFGDLGRAFRRLLAPFECPVKVYDPWLPNLLIRDHGCMPAGLDEVLGTSRIIAVFASVTSDNQAMLGRERLALIRQGSLFLLMSRAAVVDFEALVECVALGRFKASTDVFPEEPWPADHPVRKLDGMLLSAHRAGALDQVFKRIGELVLADLALILNGLPPVMCKRAEPETVARLRSMPVQTS
jgi:phosphoglycerate dehydrogenase-like enzyme